MSWLTKCPGPEGTERSRCPCSSPRNPYRWPRTPFQPLQNHQSLPVGHHSRAYFQLPTALTCLSMGLTRPGLPQHPQPSPHLASPHGPAQPFWGCVWPWFLSPGLILTPACGLMSHLASWPLQINDKDSFISVLSHSVLAIVRSLKGAPKVPLRISSLPSRGFPPRFIRLLLQFFDSFLENHSPIFLGVVKPWQIPTVFNLCFSFHSHQLHQAICYLALCFSIYASESILLKLQAYSISDSL